MVKRKGSAPARVERRTAEGAGYRGVPVLKVYCKGKVLRLVRPDTGVFPFLRFTVKVKFLDWSAPVPATVFVTLRPPVFLVFVKAAVSCELPNVPVIVPLFGTTV